MHEYNDYVAWCRYSGNTIVTCDSDTEGAFRVYRCNSRFENAFNQMADCLDDIRKILDSRDFASRLNQLQAVRDRLNFSIPETPRDKLEECETYHLPHIAELDRLLLESQNRIAELCIIIGDIEQCRAVEGDSVLILCDNPDADASETVAAVDACGDYTGYEVQRFHGKTWVEALHKAAGASRRHYAEHEDYE